MINFLGVLNAVLPFTDPSRPLWRDIVQTLILCTFLYFGPQIRLERVYDLFWRIGSKLSHIQQHNGQEIATEDANTVGEAEETPTQENLGEDEAADALNAERNERQDPLIEDIPPFEPGPALNPALQQLEARRRDANRNVRAKKAKSLARKDRQRAYNEFVREQANAQKARDADGAVEREKEASKERERRKAVEAKIAAQKAKERAEKKEREAREKGEEEERRVKALNIVGERFKTGLVWLDDVAEMVKRDRIWVEGIVKREGYLGMKEVDGKNTLTMVTRSGWLVRIDEDLMQETYMQIEELRGREDDSDITPEETGACLESILRSR